VFAQSKADHFSLYILIRILAAAAASQVSEETYEIGSIAPYAEENTPDDISVITGSMMEDDLYNSQYSANRKRKRGQDQISMQDQEHQIWADALLDYFMLADSEDRFPAPPSPPPGINLDRPIDEKGHSALHWAAAMGDLEVVKDLLSRGARIDNLSNNLETPLMRAVMFTNNYDKNTMGKLIRLLSSTVVRTDWFGSTVFHHIAATTSSKNKYLSARYYLDTIINALAETWVPDEITRLLNLQDKNGDTSIHIAARHGARKCVRSLLGRNVAVDIPNTKEETADDMIRDLNVRRRMHPGAAGRREASSSPFVPDRAPLNGDVGAIAPYTAPVIPQYRSQTANALVNRVAPAIMAKCRTLATAYEAEFEEREAEFLENEQVIRKRTAEIEALKRQMVELDMQAESVGNELQSGETEDDELRREEEELGLLEAEAMSLLEREQRDTLRNAVGKAVTDGSRTLNGGSRPQHRGPAAGPNGALQQQPNDTAESKAALAARLGQAQAERQRLTRDIVRSLSTAGLGERQTEYKRLIHGALGVREDEMESMLDEILGQLEEDRRERMVLDEGA
jgi:transcription factor MBP1